MRAFLPIWGRLTALEPFDEDAPAWRRVAGIGHAWHPSPRGRTGCMVLLIAALVLVLLLALLEAIL